MTFNLVFFFSIFRPLVLCIIMEVGLLSFRLFSPAIIANKTRFLFDILGSIIISVIYHPRIYFKLYFTFQIFRIHG